MAHDRGFGHGCVAEPRVVLREVGVHEARCGRGRGVVGARRRRGCGCMCGHGRDQIGRFVLLVIAGLERIPRNKIKQDAVRTAFACSDMPMGIWVAGVCACWC
jgi:hypothetical protein